MTEKEIEVTPLATDLNYLERKNIQLRGEIQCLNDRIAGLVKENGRLRQEVAISKFVAKVFKDIENFVLSAKTLLGKLKVN
jgi:cell division protein FtsL